MPIADVVSRTIKCDAPKCDKEVVFNPQIEADVIGLPDWIRTTRTVQLGNRSSFTYCSDVCEVEGVTTGVHNVPEPKQIETASPAQARAVGAQSEAVNQLRQRPGNAKAKAKVSLD